jgi:NAD(P)-dependent dehydrogenase (short-subunit alcohol dehydrogenase family)
MLSINAMFSKPKLGSIEQAISLRGKRAVITGAANGIGEAISFRLGEAGASLILLDVDEKGLTRLQTTLIERDIDVSLHKLDLGNKSEIDAFWDGIKADILVNNAGIYPIKDFLELDAEFFDKVMRVNLNQVLWMCQHFIKRNMNNGGVILNISSIEAILPFKGDMSHYSISKIGVLALTRGLAKDYGKKGFRVNSLIPGGIITPGTKNVAKGIAKLNLGLLKTGYDFSTRLPLGRAGDPDEVAMAALFLVSNMSSYITGAIIPVDGGFLSS